MEVTEAEERPLSLGRTQGPAVRDGWRAGSPARGCWMRSRGCWDVSTELSRGARRCTLATRAMGPPTTWQEPHLSSLPPRTLPPPALPAVVSASPEIWEAACLLQALRGSSGGSSGPPGASPGSSGWCLRPRPMGLF